MRPALLAAAILVFVTNLGEFVASIMIYRHDNLPISVYIYQQLQGGIAKAAAYSVLLIVIMVLAAGIRQLLLRPIRYE
jgi:iron(III) transport system permease protein